MRGRRQRRFELSLISSKIDNFFFNRKMRSCDTVHYKIDENWQEKKINITFYIQDSRLRVLQDSDDTLKYFIRTYGGHYVYRDMAGSDLPISEIVMYHGGMCTYMIIKKILAVNLRYTDQAGRRWYFSDRLNGWFYYD
jgi:hypothetical protein